MFIEQYYIGEKMHKKRILQFAGLALTTLAFGFLQAEGFPGRGFGDGFSPPVASIKVECMHNGEVYRSWTGVDNQLNPNPCPRTTPLGLVLNWDETEELNQIALHNSNLDNHGVFHKLDPLDEHCNFNEEIGVE